MGTRSIFWINHFRQKSTTPQMHITLDIENISCKAENSNTITSRKRKEKFAQKVTLGVLIFSHVFLAKNHEF